LRFKRTLSVLILCLWLTAAIPIQAQDNRTVLAVALPAYLMDIVTNSDLIAQFEAENPGYSLKVVDAGENSFVVPAAYSLQQHLGQIQSYATMADVLYVDTYSLSVEGTRAGYFSDLSPFVSADPLMTGSLFVPGALESFSWDNGIWGLPAAVNYLALVYNPAAFQAAGLAAPDASWTLDTLFQATEALTQYDAAGAVSLPGFLADVGYSATVLLTSEVGGVIDSSLTPATPRFTDPALVDLVTRWIEADNRGIMGKNFMDVDSVPMRLDNTLALLGRSMSGVTWMGAPLPGGVTYVDPSGFAVSSGTAYPEQAYRLAQFLTSRSDIISGLFATSAARTDVTGVDTFGYFSPENQAVITQMAAVARPYSELRFNEYFTSGLDSIRYEEGIDIPTALQKAETTAIEAQTFAANWGTQNPIVVSPPVTAADTLPPGKLLLTFGIDAFVEPLPNQDLWDNFIQSFIASDPEIGAVDLKFDFSDITTMAENYDCFFQSYNSLQNADLSTLLNLDPFMEADPSFDKNDLVSGALGQAQRDNRTWGYPLVVQPFALWYDSALFDSLGIARPEPGWSIEQFIDAVQRLHPNPTDPPSYAPTGIGGTYLYILIAAYGGLPLNLQTDPPTAAFNDPANVQAIRQVLDLAKNGMIDYYRLIDFSGGGTSVTMGANPIYDLLLNGFDFNFTAPDPDLETESPYRLTTFPTGAQYSAASYDIGAAYISAQAQNPNACYRWISALALHPELFTSMPARRSMMSSEAIIASQGQMAADFYTRFDAQLQNPSTLIFPYDMQLIREPNILMLRIWLERAYDRYVLENADLEQELNAAQAFADGYLQCAASLPPFSPGLSDTDFSNALRPYAQCAVTVDASLMPVFQGALQ
jgi:ABC-type glycerol-3-phosphate transport system substrate-binding protein